MGNALSLIHCVVAALKRERSNTVFIMPQKPDVEARETSTIEYTELHAAVEASRMDAIQILLGQGVDINDIGRASALIIATQHSHFEVVRLLPYHGSDVNQAASKNLTALMYAAINGYAKIARLQLDRGANIKAADSNQVTPLMEAAKKNQIYMMKLLLGQGAKTEASDKRHRTALIHAAEKGFVNTVRLLLDVGTNARTADTNGATALIIAG